MWDAPIHLFIILLVFAIFVVILIPIAQILHRAGHSRWWSVLYLIPLLNVVGLWIFAYVRWPALDRSER